MFGNREQDSAVFAHNIFKQLQPVPVFENELPILLYKIAIFEHNLFDAIQPVFNTFEALPVFENEFAILLYETAILEHDLFDEFEPVFDTLESSSIIGGDIAGFFDGLMEALKAVEDLVLRLPQGSNVLLGAFYAYVSYVLHGLRSSASQTQM